MILTGDIEHEILVIVRPSSDRPKMGRLCCLLGRVKVYHRGRPMQNLFDIEVTTIDGQRQRLDIFRGRVLLVVNVASRCGFTPQYAGLEDLYRRYRERGFEVLGFPCDQFGNQEPGDEAEIQSFCKRTYDVSFPMFAKIDVNGPGAHPLYRFLKHARRGLLGTKRIKWNFTKFLIDREGNVVRRYGSVVKPERIEEDVRPLVAGEVS
jgi:glutathione peroxidase